MKKRVLPLLLTVFLLAGCTGDASPETEISPGEIARAVLDGQADREGVTALSEDELALYLTNLYGLKEDDWTDAAVCAAGGMDAREIAVIVPAEGRMDAVTAALETYRQSRLGDFFGYAPAQAALVEDGKVISLKGCAALLICADTDSALTVLEDVLSGEASLLPTAVLNPDLDISGFPRFEAPNEFDMTLYDTAPILAAWENGDDSGLSKKDAAILARCREIFAEVITDGMTDREKELALHDYLTGWGSYDEYAHRLFTPLGREDNTNPYGMLVRGYGVCLGYAASFQLLMDLAGIECITVVGAAYGSSQDHAWNMVRLDGEWYCVDVTWDDPSGGEPHHYYFNVSSALLRATDHQWDYQNVPETSW